MRKFSKTTVCLLLTLMLISSPSFAGSDDVSAGEVLNTINNIFGKTSDKTTVVGIGVGRTVESDNRSDCEASGDSACQSHAGLGVNQVYAGRGKETIAVQATVVEGMNATNVSHGSASGNSANQSSSGGASNQIVLH